MKKQGLKLAVFAFFMVLGGLLPLKQVFAVQEVDYEFFNADFIGDSYSEYQESMTIAESDYIIVYVQLQDPYINSHFDYVKINNGFGDEELTKYSDTTYLKSGWFVYDNRYNNRRGSATLKIELSGDDTYINQVDVFYINGVDSLSSTQLTADSADHLDHNLNLGLVDFPYIFISGQAEADSFLGGMEVHNWSGTHSYSSSSPGLNPTMTATFTSASARSDMAFVFEGQYTLGINDLNLSRNPSLNYANPKICEYGNDCDWDFMYISITDEMATASAVWIDLETGSEIKSQDFYLNQFENFTLNISSSSGDFLNDTDAYYITIEQNSTVLWSATGTVNWLTTTTSAYNHLLPACDNSICSWLSTTTNFWSVDNFTCGLVRAGCYMAKPSDDSIDALMTSIGGMRDNFPFNTVFGVLDDITAWKTETISTSTAIIYIYKDYNQYWLEDLAIVPSSNLIYSDTGLLTEDMWGTKEDSLYDGDQSILAFINFILDLALLWIIFLIVMRRVNEHKDFEQEIKI